MFYYELKDEPMHLAFGDEEDIVFLGQEKYGDRLIGVYKDNGNAPFIPIWKQDWFDANRMKVRHYNIITNGYRRLYFDIYIASKFENPLNKDESNTLYVWFCVPGPKDSASRKEAIDILATRAVTGHRSFRSIEVTPSILRVKGAVEMLVQAVVIDTIIKDKSLIPSSYHSLIYKNR